ncbi:RagB/SusD family nutrient uptake outer membrane protein [Chitinophaga sp. GCM10012297]|uniref:RagB/SusD family nutrient uptake outer membrane protein n=1 Tax=Chitinophaga chungangae TaxID=2821488 RepID=A0ABS3Y890_9BACT|nr:RagB/SusD family nutrient uptake outer membrane protein [Chitinophaga chungangae]MBO9150851.1 RagB/SusD family nutrient uptake outer membrane protein [Chitinophaga chungangae]
MKKIFFYILGILIFTSCDSLLDVKPQSSITEAVYWQDEGDFEPYVTGIYPYMRFFANNITYGTERSEQLVSALNSRFTAAWGQNISPTSGALNYADWYRAIGHCNLLLEKIQPFRFASNPDLKKRILAETYSLRAYFYFHLTRVIGDAPLMLEAVTDTEVPLLARSPAPDVIRQITADLDEAIALFKSTGGFTPAKIESKYRFSYASAQALKADVKLWSAKVLGGGNADLNAAIEALNEVEKSGATLNADFKNAANSRAASNPEVLLAAFFLRDEPTGAVGGVPATSHMCVNAFPYKTGVDGASNLDSLPYAETTANGQGAYQISPKSKALFTDPADKRIPYTWVTERHGTELKISWITKFTGTIYADGRVADNDIPMYRLADIFLMKAEAYAALNQTTDAIEYLEKVRLRAGTGEYTGATDKQSVEKEILDERGRELFFENKRWYDLVRFHKGGTIDVYTYVPNLVGKTTPLFWPLNVTVLANNSLIKQTEGYK